MRLFPALFFALPLFACAAPAPPEIQNAAERMAWIPVRDDTGAPQGLRARICRPDGAGPFPVAVINHGAPPEAAETTMMQPTNCDSVPARWFRARGYLVVFALRRGFGESTGPIAESSGPCANPDYVRAGRESARDISAIVRFAANLPEARPDDIVVIGQSTGGWGTIAYDDAPAPGVVGLISMAGGRGGRAFGTAASYCQPDSLVAAAGVFGARAEKPMLWISAANDTYFDPDLERRMARAFGAATLVVTPPLGAEGHFLFYDAGGPEIWGPIVTRYLDQRRQAAAPKS